MKEVLCKLRETISKEEAGAYLIRNPSDIKYVLRVFTRSFPPYLAVIVFEDKVVGITTPLEENRAKDFADVDRLEIYSAYDLEYWEKSKSMEEKIKKILEREKVKKCLSDVKLNIEGIEIKEDDKIEEMRMLKSKEELRRIKEAIYAAEKAMDCAFSMIEPGISEKEIASEITSTLMEISQGPSFDVIVASGPNSAYPHHEPGRRILKRGDPVIIDLGAYYEGYASDMTRTFFVGGEVEDLWSRVYNIVLEMQKKAIKEAKDGVKASRVDRASREYLSAEEGEFSGRNYCHSLGHGVGLDVHEPPYLAPTGGDKDYTLREGMVFTIEPGIYLHGLGGVRIEDMVVIEGGRAKVLTSFEK